MAAAAAAAGREDDQLQLQLQGKSSSSSSSSSWLPSHHPHHHLVLDHHHAAAWNDVVVYRSKERVGKQLERKNRSGVPKQQRESSNLLHHPVVDPQHQLLQLLRPKSSQRPSSRTRQPPSDWVVAGGGGGGMRAIFLDSRQKPCSGTGVFLPRNAGASNSMPTNNSSGCSPVLLPARVVQALNLNVNEIALQVTRRHQLGDAKSSFKPLHNNNAAAAAAARNNNVSNVERPQNENASPEIFLPKEWTY